MRPVLALFGCLLIACVFITPVAAQSDRGTITGTVLDPAGAVVPNAAIQAKNIATGLLYPTQATETGNYTIPQLPVGSYELTVTVSGFKKFVRSGLTVQVAQTMRVDIPLEVGSASEAVTVVGEASLLRTESGDLSYTVGLNNLNDLPLFPIGSQAGTQGIRNPNAIALIMPGVYWNPNLDLRVNGVPANTQSYRIEGQEAVNSGTPGTPGQNQPSVDAIQEVAIQVSNFAAEYGQVGGGVFNLTMRSGTNQFHGSVYEYYVNEVFNANTPFTGTDRQKQRRNDYGFTIGGPVAIPKIYNGHDKTFFFVAWEEFKETQNINNSQQTVPTMAYRGGNFASAITGKVIGTDPIGNQMLEGMIYDPKTTTTDPVTGKVYRMQFPNNQIPQNATYLDPVAQKIQALIPLPQGVNANGLVQNYVNPYVSHRISPIPSVKIDQVVGSKGRLSFFWQKTHTENPDGNNTLGQSDGLPGLLTTALGTFTDAPLYRLNYDHTLTPTILLHFGAGYRSTSFNVPSVTPDGKIVYTDVQYDASKELGLNGGLLHRFFPAMSGLLASNGQTGGMKNFASEAYGPAITQSPTFNASATRVKGNHTYKVGSEFRTEGYPPIGVGNDGTFAFAADQTGQPFQNNPVAGANVGFPYASFLLGAVKTVSMAGPTTPRTGKKQFGIYIQDTWKVTHKFTLDYGLRWDYSTYLQEEYGRAPDFSGTTIHPILGIPGAAVYEGGPNSCNCNFAHNYPFAFGPRLGAAYQINSKTVFRAGFGIVYSGTEQNNNATGGLASSSSTTTSAVFGSPVMTLANGIPASFDPRPWPTYDPAFFPTGNVTTPGTSAINMDRNAGRPARQYQWSVGFQREIFRNLVIEAAYVANRGIWWQSPGLIDLNAISYARLAAVGLDPINNVADRVLLSTQLAQLTPAQKARGFGALPYAGFPLTQTVAQTLRPFPQFSSIPNAWNPLGKSWYDSLQIKVTQRLSHGLTFFSNITWSKNLALGGEREPNFGTAASGTVNDVFNRSVNKILSSYSQPLVFETNLSYITPKTHGNKWLSFLLQDWTTGVSLAYRSGLPILAPAAQGLPTDKTLSALLFQSTFAIRDPSQPLYNVDINCHCYDPQKTVVLNKAAWIEPPAGTFGTSAMYSDDYRFQRRPSENLNFGRTFRIRERVTLNIRAEFTNFLNRAWIGNPNTTNATGTGSAATFQPNGNTANGFGVMLPTTTFPSRNGLMVARIQF